MSLDGNPLPPPPALLLPLLTRQLSSGSAGGAWASSGRTAAELLRGAKPASVSVGEAPSSSSHASEPRNQTGSSAVPVSSSAVGAMVAMGIDEAWAASALRRCGGSDVAQAVDFCFSHDMAPLVESDSRLVASVAEVRRYSHLGKAGV